MSEPYRMIFVNLIGSFTLIIGTIFYRFLYPKKHINLFIILLLITILPIISIFRSGTYESGDFNIHIYRSMAFFDSLREGNFMPSWAKDLNATYGYPLFIFNYPLPYYIISFFHFVGFSFITSMKLFLGLNLVASGIFMYLFVNNVLKNKLSAFTSAIFYVFAPYHLIDVHFKIGIGEILTFTLIPLCFLGIRKLYFKRSVLNILFSSMLIALLIMSHPAIALFHSVIFLGYILLLQIRNKSTFFIQMLSPLTIGFALSSYSWLGPIILQKYTVVQSSALKTVYFPTITDLFYSPWRMGFLFQGPSGETSFLIGYTQLVVVILILFLILKNNIPAKKRADEIFWLLVFIVFSFLITPYSKMLWEHSWFLKPIGSHRLLLIIAFSTSVLAGYLVLLARNRKTLIYLLITITVGYTILNWGHRRLIPEINDAVLRTNIWKSTSEGEGHFYAAPKWVDQKHLWSKNLPKAHMEILKGVGEIKSFQRSSTIHVYQVLAKTSLEIRENTLYFPGWKIKSNGWEIPINYTENGIIKFILPKGSQHVELTYQDVFELRLLKWLSGLSFFAIFLYIFFATTKRLVPIFSSSSTYFRKIFTRKSFKKRGR